MNILRFIKNWTLPLAMSTGTVVYLIFAFTPPLDAAARFFAPIFETILPLFMFLILFTTFCKVNFRAMRPVWWHLWINVLNLVFVIVCMAVILVLRLKGDMLILMEGILMCIIAPGATAAAVVTQKLGGSLEEITTYTFLSNFLCVVLVPVCFPMIEKAAHITFWQAFIVIFQQVFLVLVVPMIMAYFVKHHMHRLHRWIVSVKDISYYMWGCSLMIVTGTTVKNIVHADTTVSLLLAIAALGFVVCVVQYVAGRLVGRRYDRVLECGQALGQKNTAFAIWIAYTFLNPLSSVGPGCYILWQNIINSVEIWQRRKAEERTLAEQTLNV